MNWAMGWTNCAARGRIPTHTPIGTHTRLANPISMKTRSMVRAAKPQTCNASMSGVLRISTAMMCQNPRTTAATTKDTHNRSRLRLFLWTTASTGTSSERLTTRLVHSTAE